MTKPRRRQKQGGATYSTAVNRVLAAPSTKGRHSCDVADLSWLTAVLYVAPPCFCRMRGFVGRVGTLMGGWRDGW